MTQRPDTATLASFTYDPRSRRYKNLATGRFVAAKEVRGAVDTIIDKETVKVKALAQNLVDGKISLAEWQLGMQQQVKVVHVAMGLAANGGLNATSPGDLGYIGNLVKQQYKYLQGFVKEVRNGSQLLDGTLVSRSALYAQSARGTYEDVIQRAARNGGATQEKSVLGVADHCSDCVGEAAKGWSEIGSLIAIGERKCRANCHCTFQYK